jgi:ethanolamine utilization protein EutM
LIPLILEMVIIVTKAIGMIETIGVAVSIEVADAMIKAADVRIINQETFDASLITISIEGDISSVNAAMEAGKRAALKTGQLFAFCVMANPDRSIESLIAKKMKRENFQTIFPRER